jgi:F-type H+-transporting ATPase subunit delta
MTNSMVARRYVDALYELAGEQDIRELIGTQLKEISELINREQDLKSILHNPGIKAVSKIAIFDELLKSISPHQVCASFIRLIIRKDRINLLTDMCTEYERLERERKGILMVEVTSARALDEATTDELRGKLESATGKMIELQLKENPDLIGGIVARIGSTVYDGSIDHQLALIQQRLEEE